MKDGTNAPEGENTNSAEGGAGRRRLGRAAGGSAKAGAKARSSEAPEAGAQAGATPPAGSAAPGGDAAPKPGADGAEGQPAAVKPEEAPPTVRDAVSSAAVEGFDLSALGEHDSLSFSSSDEVDMENVKLKILLYGDSGAGKTYFASNADGVCVALVEPQGFATIRATGRKVLVPGKKGRDGTPRITTAQELRDFMLLARSGRLKAAGVRIIVFDSGTEIMQLFIDEILAEKRKAPAAQKDAKGQQQPKAKGPAPEMTQADWGVLGNKMRNFLRMVRDLDYVVVMLALTITAEDEENGTKIRRVYPSFQGSTRQNIAAYFNLVGYIYKLAGERPGEVNRYVIVDADERFYTKSFGPIRGIVEADLEAWLDALAGGESSVQAAGAKLPGAQRRRLGGKNTTQTPTTQPDGAGGDEGDDDPEGDSW